MAINQVDFGHNKIKFRPNNQHLIFIMPEFVIVFIIVVAVVLVL